MQLTGQGPVGHSLDIVEGWGSTHPAGHEGRGMFTRGPGRFELSDAVRGLHFSLLTSYEHGYVTVAMLTSRGMRVPFEYTVDQRQSEGGVYYEVVIGHFGYSDIANARFGTGRAEFASDELRSRTILEAGEAVLAFEPMGHALERGDGYNRLSLWGRRYTLSDFGDYFLPGAAADA